jgi:hypothetical protein
MFIKGEKRFAGSGAFNTDRIEEVFRQGVARMDIVQQATRVSGLTNIVRDIPIKASGLAITGG